MEAEREHPSGDRCELCARRVPDLTVHHLIPKEEGGAGGETLDVCPACHHQIHALFDNRTLAEELNTVAALLAEPRVSRFVRWVRKQDPGKRVAVRSQRSP